MQQSSVGSELILLQKALSGDQAAFCEFAESFRRLIYQIAFRYFHNEADALDVCQDVMITILRKGHLYRGEGSLEGWVRTITANTCKNALRTKHPERYQDDFDFESMVAENESSPEGSLMSGQNVAHVKDCISQLPDKQRMTVILKIYQDLTLKEVADTLNCTLGTAKANFFHAVANLRHCLEKKL